MFQKWGYGDNFIIEKILKEFQQVSLSTSTYHVHICKENNPNKI